MAYRFAVAVTNESLVYKMPRVESRGVKYASMILLCELWCVSKSAQCHIAFVSRTSFTSVSLCCTRFESIRAWVKSRRRISTQSDGLCWNHPNELLPQSTPSATRWAIQLCLVYICLYHIVSGLLDFSNQITQGTMGCLLSLPQCIFTR